MYLLETFKCLSLKLLARVPCWADVIAVGAVVSLHFCVCLVLLIHYSSLYFMAFNFLGLNLPLPPYFLKNPSFEWVQFSCMSFRSSAGIQLRTILLLLTLLFWLMPSCTLVLAHLCACMSVCMHESVGVVGVGVL